MNLGKDDKHALAHLAVDGLLAQDMINFEHEVIDRKDYIKVRIKMWGMRFNIATIAISWDPKNSS